jgi:hypothetical protein
MSFDMVLKTSQPSPKICREVIEQDKTRQNKLIPTPHFPSSFTPTMSSLRV